MVYAVDYYGFCGRYMSNLYFIDNKLIPQLDGRYATLLLQIKAIQKMPQAKTTEQVQ